MKLSTILLLVLAGTMISIVPAKSYADPQLDILLSIAKQAKDSLGITISQISSVPDQVNMLYQEGSNETDALAQAASHQDAASAKQHFLAAMKYFKETNDMINSLNATAASSDQQRAEANQLRGEVVRLENMGNLLKSIASQNNVDVNFTGFDGLLQNATADLNAGNLTDASGQVQSANEFIVATHSSLNRAAEERNSQMAKDFTERQIAQLNSSAGSNATGQNNSSTPSTGAPNGTGRANEGKIEVPPTAVPHVMVQNNSNSAIYNNPREMVDKLKQLVAEGKVDEAISLIKAIQEYQRASLANQSAERLAEHQPPEVSQHPEQEVEHPVQQAPGPVNGTVQIPPPVNGTIPVPPPVNNMPHALPPVNNATPAPPVNGTMPVPPPVNNIPHALPPVSNATPAPPVNGTMPVPPPVNGTVQIPPAGNSTMPVPPPGNSTVPTAPENVTTQQPSFNNEREIPPPANHTMPTRQVQHNDHGQNQGQHNDHGQNQGQRFDRGQAQIPGQQGSNQYYQSGNGDSRGRHRDH
ncbi:MAG: hypothetical protein KGI33_06690 [Thaumarchaeota archaeon]|nr:hypothetical protein [Nitrososphaerota archaeon]